MKILKKAIVVMCAIATSWSVAEANGEIKTTPAKKSLKILMIGNSFSICNTRNMPQICQSMGLDLELGSLYIGGCSLARHWENVKKEGKDFAPYSYRFFKAGKQVKNAPKKWNVPEALRSKAWDIVTIQQASHFSIDIKTYSPYGENLIAKIKELCPSAEIVLQETWSYTPFDNRLKKWGIDQNEMYARLNKAYYDFAKANSLRVIPVGQAVQMWRKMLPVKYTENSLGGDVVGDLKFTKKENGSYEADGDPFHFNEKGNYLQSMVWTAMLFDVDVTKCKFIRDKTIGAENCRLMQKIANEVVK
ncbi:MAG: DUF4886 domain-containing protein [Kiritimatiellae bacterium]|nr:DUF4886 domain-containing protein [Kiritimatiellia bacterium]